MNFHDQNKQSMTYECIPELVVTVPAGCSTKNCLHSLLRFITEFLSAVVKISRHYA